jgi:N-acetylglucosamine kinase-like BadF-type ATPase
LNKTLKLYLGVDGGQSSTTAVIGDEAGTVIGSGRGGPCNHVGAAEGRAKFIRAIGGCIAMACAEAGLDPASVEFESACLGFSGGPHDKEALLDEILRARKRSVTTDAVIALTGATGGRPGIITIAGTGSIAMGRNASGRIARAGGWGYIYGDEGGGFDITRQAVRAALRHEEGWGPPTVLRDILLSETGAKDANEMMHDLYTTDFPRPRIASFSKLVDQTAREGDLVARNIMTNAAQQLATFTSAVRSQLFEPEEPASLAYIGGVFRSEILLERYTMLVELEDGNQLHPPLYGPAAGALIEAYRADGIEPTLTHVPEFEK